MTTQQAQQFLERVNEAKALLSELRKALQAEDDIQAVTDIAKAREYDFTPQELWVEVKRHQIKARKNVDRELSEKQLEAVAGGKSFWSSYFSEFNSFDFSL